MSKGKIWPVEWKDTQDPVSGIVVKQLTSYRAHSHHLYFTNPGWYDGGRRMLFSSDRENTTNLFSIDLESGYILQLTDYAPQNPPYETQLGSTCVNPTRPEAYYWYGRDLMVIDLHSLAERVLWTIPAGFSRSMLNCTSDGKSVCVGIHEDLSDRIRIDLHRGYVGFREIFEAHPLSRIYQLDTGGMGDKIAWEEQSWVGHVNTSPTQPHLLTFCHEGPWQLVDNRIWCLDLNKRQAVMIRPRREQESVGHEYWHADGIHIGYHGFWNDGRRFFGKTSFDNQSGIEVDFPHETGHIHSNDFNLVVGDSSREGKTVRLWRWNGASFDGPKVLCEHRSSFHTQEVHVHPRFDPAGRYVVYTSDVTGYGNVYLAEVPDFDSLPPVVQGSSPTKVHDGTQ
jgi:oligogalacturonide lyase